ncbi:MAG TPA: right-handed parallel beta-helix repeat-containing protein [Streptosporangiaceae bacterium]|nr:right-handed parallel beta-helix repeat-containing protein [Streptosporangiaceae bacterium]
MAIFAIGGSVPAHAAVITAACNNTASDAATIQSAITSSAMGDEITIQGSCLINATIKLLGGRTYQGQNRVDTVLKQASGANLPAILASDSWVANTTATGLPIVLRDLTIDGNKSANPTAGDALVIRSWDTTIEDLEVLNSNGDGIKITNKSQNGTALTGTQVNGTIQNVYVSQSGADGIRVEDSGNSVTDWNLLDSRISSSGNDAINLDNAAGWVVERNHVYGNGAAGISARRLFASSISDNYIEDFNTSGITATVQGDAASVIMGNRIFQFSGTGTTFLGITQVNYGTGEVAVTGNVIRGGGTGTGLSYQRGSNQLTVTSTGNLVQNVATPRSAGAGVVLATAY